MLILDQKMTLLIDITGAAVKICDGSSESIIVANDGTCIYELGTYSKERSREILREICEARMKGMELFRMPEE